VWILRQASREHTPSRSRANDNHVVSHSILSFLDAVLWCASRQYTPGLGLQLAFIHGTVVVVPPMVPWALSTRVALRSIPIRRMERGGTS
jgi:hypothetical protein